MFYNTLYSKTINEYKNEIFELSKKQLLDEAIIECKQGINEYDELKTLLADLNVKKENYEEAYAILIDYSKTHIDDDKIYSKLAYIQYKRNIYSSSIEFSNKAIAIDPFISSYYLTRSNTYKALDDNNNYLNDLNTGIEIAFFVGLVYKYQFRKFDDYFVFQNSYTISNSYYQRGEYRYNLGNKFQSICDIYICLMIGFPNVDKKYMNEVIDFDKLVIKHFNLEKSIIFNK